MQSVQLPSRAVPVSGHRRAHRSGKELHRTVALAHAHDCRPSEAAFLRGSPVSAPAGFSGRMDCGRCSASRRIVAFAVPASLPVVPEQAEQLKQLPRDVENMADDPGLHNPLVVMEWEGVVVADVADLHRQAWVRLATDEGKPVPLHFTLKRADGMKNDQVIKEVLCWTREPIEVRRLAERKEAEFSRLMGDQQPLVASGVREFMENLAAQQVPAALATSAPEARVKPALESQGMGDAFVAVVTAEDVYRGRPDPEAYLLAAQLIGRPPARCVVIGNSNQSVEAARECGMAAVVLAGQKPLFELGAADLVVKALEEVKFANLKQLFAQEGLVAAQEPEPEMEASEEPEDTYSW